MKGSGVFLVRMPNGKPWWKVFVVPGLAMDRARIIGGEVVEVKNWNPPIPKARNRARNEGGRLDKKCEE
jgi:hypothetical protein